MALLILQAGFNELVDDKRTLFPLLDCYLGQLIKHVLPCVFGINQSKEKSNYHEEMVPTMVIKITCSFGKQLTVIQKASIC